MLATFYRVRQTTRILKFTKINNKVSSSTFRIDHCEQKTKIKIELLIIFTA